jgi:4-aminobutyrate aminotransferase/(S)-3-amino-2-methylpropionate transaminase
MARRKQAVPRGPFNTAPFFAAKASGARIIDVEGRDLIDFAGGIGVMGTGHNHPKIIAAAKSQMDAFVHTCFHVVPYEGYVRLAEELNARTPGSHAKKTMFANSGAEAVENAVKVARAGTNRPGILCFDNAFHGRTLLAMTLTSKISPYKHGFGPFAPEVTRVPYAYCYRCPFGAAGPESCSLECAENLREAFINEVDPTSVAAIIAEPVQGEGGFVVAPPAFLKRVQEIGAEHGILFIADEVQSGFGRTGHLFACEAFGVVPDIMAMAKALASGFPLSAVTGKAELMEVPQVGGLGGTYAGNPVSIAAALATLEVIDEERLVERARTMGSLVKARFEAMQQKYDLIGDVRGLGLMMAMELVTDRKTKAPATAETARAVGLALEKGLLLVKAGTYSNVIRLLPPLTISQEDLTAGLDILEESLAAVAEKS